jgi:hypothetical protein
MSVTFNTPVRVFKRNNPTNDGTIAPDNTGAAIVSREKAVVGGTATTVVIPAGAIVRSVTAYVTTAAGTPGTPNVTIGAEVVGTLSDAAGINAITFGTGATAVGLLANVGTSDVTLSYTAGADAVGYLSVAWTARNPDGTITNVGEGYTNE